MKGISEQMVRDMQAKVSGRKHPQSKREATLNHIQRDSGDTTNLNRMPQNVRDRLIARYPDLAPVDTRRGYTVKKHRGQAALESSSPTPVRLVDISGPLLVRLTRVGQRRYDDDNLVGGAKQLRDAIAEMLGRDGDSEEDGLRFEYAYRKGPPETIIEIYDDPTGDDQ